MTEDRKAVVKVVEAWINNRLLQGTVNLSEFRKEPVFASICERYTKELIESVIAEYDVLVRPLTDKFPAGRT